MREYDHIKPNIDDENQMLTINIIPTETEDIGIRYEFTKQTIKELEQCISESYPTEQNWTQRASESKAPTAIIIDLGSFEDPIEQMHPMLKSQVYLIIRDFARERNLPYKVVAGKEIAKKYFATLSVLKDIYFDGTAEEARAAIARDNPKGMPPGGL